MYLCCIVFVLIHLCIPFLNFKLGHQIRQAHCFEISTGDIVDFHKCDNKVITSGANKAQACDGDCPKGITIFFLLLLTNIHPSVSNVTQ